VYNICRDLDPRREPPFEIRDAPKNGSLALEGLPKLDILSIGPFDEEDVDVVSDED